VRAFLLHHNIAEGIIWQKSIQGECRREREKIETERERPNRDRDKNTQRKHADQTYPFIRNPL
jgi:hypothetical protein